MVEHRLTPEERRALGMAALTGLLTGLVAGSVQWAFEEAKAWMARCREEKAKPPLVTLE